MARIEGEIVIGRPLDVVFDYVADQSNEPQYNPRMVRAEKITAGPVGKGTQFRSAVASMGRTAEMLIEYTGYDRPALLASATTMQQADISYTLRFEPAAAGTRMRWSGHVRPRGVFRLLGPVITWMGIRQEQRIWTSLKEHLEAAPAGPEPAGSDGRSEGVRLTCLWSRWHEATSRGVAVVLPARRTKKRLPAYPSVTGSWHRPRMVRFLPTTARWSAAASVTCWRRSRISG